MLLIVPWEGSGGARSKREGEKKKGKRDTDPDFRDMVMMRIMNAVGQWNRTHTQTDSNRVCSLAQSSTHTHTSKGLKRTASLITNRINHDSFWLSNVMSPTQKYAGLSGITTQLKQIWLNYYLHKIWRIGNHNFLKANSVDVYFLLSSNPLNWSH